MRIGVDKETIQVRSYQVGPGSTLSFTSMFQLFQEAAYRHAENLNWGYELLQSEGMVWILSRLRVDVQKKPRWNQELLVETAPYTPFSLWAPRDFLLRDDSGEILCRATSHWLLVNIETLRPIPPKELFGQIEFLEPHGLCRLDIGKIKAAGDMESLGQRGVYASHLDQNNHVNNSRYVDFVIDSLTEEEQMNLSGLELHYLKECFAGDRIEVLSAKDSEGMGLRIFKRGEDNVLAARLYT